MSRSLLAGFALAAMLLAGACNINACNYETRFIGVTGSATSGTATITIDAIGFREYNPDRPGSNSLSVLGHGEGFSSAPASMVLLDDRDASRTVATLSFQGSTVSFATSGAVDVSTSDRDYLFDVLNSGHSYVLLRLANGTSIRIPMIVAIQEDWNRPDCN